MNSLKHSPHVLVADDDPVSRAFFSAALQEIGCDAETVADGSSTLRAVASVAFDLMLLDCRMPDIGGAALLAALRAAGTNTPAIATSAAIASQRESLLAAGFAGILEKPTTVATLLETIGTILTLPDGVAPVLDDHAALGSLGNRETVRSLRALLADEIRELLTLLHDCRTSARTITSDDRLHRLRASCGFCGAPALAAAAAQLEHAIQNGQAISACDLEAFERACAATLEALNA